MSKYERIVIPNFEKIKELRHAGQTEPNIAKYLGIAYNTFREYKKQHPEFQKLLDDAKGTLVENLEQTMYQMALGKVKVTETKKYIQRGADGEDKTRIEEIVKDIPPSVPLLIFSLKNLAGDKWRDSPQDVTMSDVEVAMKNMNTVFTEMKSKLNKVSINEEKDDKTS